MPIQSDRWIEEIVLKRRMIGPLTAIIDSEDSDTRFLARVRTDPGDQIPERYGIGKLSRALSHPQKSIDDLRWEVDLCALRDHCERNAILVLH